LTCSAQWCLRTQVTYWVSEVFMTVKIQIVLFWVMTPYSLIDSFRNNVTIFASLVLFDCMSLHDHTVSVVLSDIA
jgi:hypothetical protein